MPISAVNSRVKLSPRLSLTASMVRDSSRVVDVGCDHGKLLAWLITSGRCIYAYAVDISRPSLKKATDLFVELAIQDRVQSICADGLDDVSSDDVDDIVIAGLGSDTIERIISRAPWLKDSNKHLILVPSSRHAQLRRYIYSEGYEIIKEEAVEDASHCYTVMSVRYSGVVKHISNSFAAIGKICESAGAKDRYLEQTYMRAVSLISKIQHAKEYDITVVAEVTEVAEYIEDILKGGKTAND